MQRQDPTTLGVEDAIRYVFGDAAAMWRCIAVRESSLNPRAGAGTPFIGLLQIWVGHCPALIDAGVIPNCDALYNPYYNCQAAAWVFGPDGQGCGAWPNTAPPCGCGVHQIAYEPPPAPVPIPDGSLVTYSGAGGTFWMIAKGQRRRIVSIQGPGDVFAACGYDVSSLQTLPEARVTAMPVGADITGPPDCPYGNPAIAEGSLATYPGAGGSVWLIVNGRRRRIVSLRAPGDVFAACGYNANAVRTFPELQVVSMPVGADITGPPDCPYGHPPRLEGPPPIPSGQLVSYYGSGGRVWVIVPGPLRREIISLHVVADVFAACGYQISKIYMYQQAEIVAIPIGPDITGPPDCPGIEPPPPVPQSFSLNGVPCNTAAVQSWMGNRVNIGRVTSADAQALITTYGGRLDLWVGTVYGRNGFGVVDMIALRNACAS